jgi:hypothetical protein
MLPSGGREASVAVQEGRGDEPPLRREVCPCAQSALALWLTSDRYTIPVGLRVDKRLVLLTNGKACAQRSETVSSGRTRSEGTWSAPPRALLDRQVVQDHRAVQRVTRPLLRAKRSRPPKAPYAVWRSRT